LVRAGARLVVANRGRERGQRLAAELGAAFLPAGELAGLEYDAAVNATPLGMHPRTGETPLPAGLIRPGAAVFDTVYNPVETRLLREAKERGARPVDGVGMFVEQAARQIEIWTGLRPPVELMREVAMKKLGGD
jgi:shikimate 5-dehydrogenase